MSKPYLLKRGSQWYSRIRVPQDLRPFLGAQIVQTLRTENFRLARKKIIRKLEIFAIIWDEIRIRAQNMDNNQKNTNLRLHFFERLQELERDPSRDETAEITLTKAEARALLQEARPNQIGPQYPAATTQGPAQFVAEVLAHLTRVLHGPQQPPAHGPLTTNPTGAITTQQSGALIGALATALTPPQAAHPTHRRAPEKRRGPAWPVPGEDNGDPRRWQRLPELLEAYFGCRDLSEKTKVSTTAAVRDFDALVRGRPIGEISPQDLALYKQTIMARPGRVGRAQAAPATVQKLLNHVRCVLSWATDEEAIITVNPGAKVRPPAQKRKAQVEDAKRRAFSLDAQTRLFSSPLYTGCMSRDRLSAKGDHVYREDTYYFFLCSYLTGARTSELPGSHVFKHGATWCLDLRETGTKTGAAKRIVPILPALEKTGFVDWALTRQKNGELFKGKRVPQNWSRVANYYLEQIDLKDRHHVAYSLRHCFKQMLRTSNLNTELANRIFGHSSNFVGEQYGIEYLSEADAVLAVKAIKPPISLEHLYFKK